MNYLNASGKLAAILYKEEIERALKTPGFSGFQLLDLHDFPGQGTALVGLLDAFWDSKGIVAAEDFRNFCSPVVPLTRFPKAIYTNNELFEATVEIANYAASDIENKKISWNLFGPGRKSVASGYFDAAHIEKGKNSVIGKISASLNQVTVATCLTLEVAVVETPYKNSWSVWVYPENVAINAGDVCVTDNLEKSSFRVVKGSESAAFTSCWRIKGYRRQVCSGFLESDSFSETSGKYGDFV